MAVSRTSHGIYTAHPHERLACIFHLDVTRLLVHCREEVPASFCYPCRTARSMLAGSTARQIFAGLHRSVILHPQPGPWTHDMIAWIPSAQVVGVSKLRTKYESHEAKRILAGAYDLFVADERVIPSLPKLLGASGGLRPCALPCP